MRILPPIVVLAATLAACSGDGTGPGAETPRALTGAEASAISRAILSPGVTVARDGASGAASSSAGDGTAAAVETGRVPFSFRVPCQPTGSMAVSGSVSAAWDLVAQVAAVHAEASLRPESCPVQSQGSVVTVTGDPSLTLTLTAAGNAQGLQAVLVTQSGALNWTRADGAAGRCAVEVAGLLVAGTPNYHVTGTVCGTSVDYTGPL
jgi:hypothetical protein